MNNISLIANSNQSIFKSKKGFIFYINIFCLLAVMLSPTLVFQNIGLLTLETPDTVRYVLWLPTISVLDLLLIISSFTIFLGTIYVDEVKMYTIPILVGICIICVQALLIQALNGYGVQYYDGILYTVRYLLIFFLVSYLVQKYPIFTLKIFISILIILSSISITATFILGYEGILNGRINFIGMGPNVSSDLAIMILSLTILSAKNGWIGRFWLISCMFFVIIYVPLTGSRRALVFLIACLFYWNARFIILAIIPTVITLYFIFAQIFSEIDISNLVSITRSIESIIDIINGDFNDGRSVVFSSLGELLSKFPLGVGLSDWAIQSELTMQLDGIDSHSHNWIIQFYLKFGVMAIFFLGIIINYIYLFLKSEYYFHAIFILISMFTGYGWWNIKWVTALFFFMLFLKQSRSFSSNLYTTNFIRKSGFRNA